MTTTRILTLVAAVTAALATTGCPGKTCNDATPPVKQTPAACTAVTGTALTVPLRTCPRCDQAEPTCDVRASGAGRFSLEPVSQVCDPSSSCPIPNLSSCSALATNCVLTAAMTAGLTAGSTYYLDIITETGVETKPLTVASAGSPDCTY